MYWILRVAAHTVAAGGDYSYNLMHVIPNTVGNFVGYLGLFIANENALPLYEALRMQTKHYALPMSGLGLLVVLLVVWLVIKKRQVFRNETGRLCVFGLAFAFISLLPFLPLGNISERYLYLASIGFIIAATALARSIVRELTKGSLQFTIVVCSIVSVLLLVWWGGALQKEQSDWRTAGKITYNALGYFKIEQSDIPQGSTLYIVNRPIRYGSAWVFPVGLPDGLWFIYRDDTQVVNYAPSVGEAKALAGQHAQYIFTFDKKGAVSQVQ